LNLGHYALWEAGIHHRDISTNNLMCYMYKNQPIGVLNDFDLAIVADEHHRLARERTGTLPFMALELLEHLKDKTNIPHQYGGFLHYHRRSNTDLYPSS
jgi:serine/threonine protein kinase